MKRLKLMLVAGLLTGAALQGAAEVKIKATASKYNPKISENVSVAINNLLDNKEGAVDELKTIWSKEYDQYLGSSPYIPRFMGLLPYFSNLALSPKGTTKTLEILISTDSRLANAQDDKGITPLMTLAQAASLFESGEATWLDKATAASQLEKRLGWARILLQYGANIAAQDDEGHDAAYYGRKSPSFLALLKEYSK